MGSFKCAILALTWLVLLASCVTQRRCMEKYPPVPVDTVTVENTVYKDTTFYVQLPADTLRDTVELVLPCPPPPDFVKVATVENRFAKATAKIVRGRLTVELMIKDAVLEKHIDSLAVARTKTVTITNNVVIEKKVIPPFYKACLYVSIAFFILFVIFIFVALWRI